MPRKAKGVFEKVPGSGRWWVRLPTGQPGKYRKESIGTREQALQVFEERTAKPGPGPTLAAAMRRFLELRRVNHSYHTHARYFARRFPGWTLKQFVRIDVLRSWQAERRQERAASTVNHEMAFLSGVLKQAEEDELIPANLIGKGKGKLAYLPQPKGRTRWLPEDQEHQLAAALRPETWEAALFAINTGLRRGEQWALMWADWQGDHIWVRPAKTGKGRHVYLNRTAREILARRRKEGLPSPFPSAGPAGLARHFNRTTKRIGMDLSWHSLRHSCATRLMRARVAPRVVQRVLGWSSLTMVEHYSHVSDDQCKEAMELLCR